MRHGAGGNDFDEVCPKCKSEMFCWSKYELSGVKYRVVGAQSLCLSISFVAYITSISGSHAKLLSVIIFRLYANIFSYVSVLESGLMKRFRDFF